MKIKPKTMDELIEQVKNDIELRPLFFETVSTLLVLGLTDKFEVSNLDRVKIEVAYYDSLSMLHQKVAEKISHERLMEIIQAVSMLYLSQVGRFKVEDN